LKINKFIIKNFRNIKKIEYKPCSDLNIFIGDNAQGKTNILEAIFVLATGSSFRSNQNSNLIKYEEKKFTLKSIYQYEERLIRTALEYQVDGNKKFEINSKKVNHNNPDCLRVVLFTPDDLYLIKGTPLKRRNFLDFILKQVSKDYIATLDNYSKILKKRNFLLKNDKANSKTFYIVEDLFIENAARLILARINFINILDDTAWAVYKELNNKYNHLKIRYALSFPVNSDKINFDILKDKLKEQIKVKKEKEVVLKRSLVGPHLDDVYIYLDNKMARLFASQGQQRNIIISIKLAELYTMKKLLGFYPVFLLDEVLSELDDKKKILLIKYLIRADFQSFLTSVDLNKIGNINKKISTVNNGYLQ